MEQDLEEMWLIRHYPVAVGRNPQRSGRCAVIFPKRFRGFRHTFERVQHQMSVFRLKTWPTSLAFVLCKTNQEIQTEGSQNTFPTSKFPTSLLCDIALKRGPFNAVPLSFSKVKKMLLCAFNVGKLYFGWNLWCFKIIDISYGLSA